MLINRRVSLQVLFILALCVFITLVPWWVVLLGMLIPLFLFESFYGAIIIGFLMDTFYGHSAGLGFSFPFLVTVIILVFLIPILKHRLISWKPQDF